VHHLQARVLALQGRGGDTRIAHVTPGEVVVPKRMQTRAFMTALHALARAHGIDPAQLRVASGRNRINPNTGEMEFDFYDPLEDLNLGSLTHDFNNFDPSAYDPGNFNVNNLSGHTAPSTDFSYSGGAPEIGNLTDSFNTSIGPLATSIGSLDTNTPSYTDADGQPIEGITVTSSRSPINDLTKARDGLQHGISAVNTGAAGVGLLTGIGAGLGAPVLWPAAAVGAGLFGLDYLLNNRLDNVNQRINDLNGSKLP